MAEELKACPFCGGDANAAPESQHYPGCYFDVLASLRAAKGGDISLVPEVLRAWNRRAQLPSRGGEAVEVVGYHNPISKDWSYVGRVGWEPLMTVTQHQRILAAATHPADQVADDLTMVKVSRELLYRIKNVYAAGLTMDAEIEELRTLLAKSEATANGA